MMIIKDQEIARIQSLARVVMSSWPMLGADVSLVSPGFQIAALRYHVKPGNDASRDALLLCKLIENNSAEAERMFVVTRDVRPIAQHPVIAPLLKTYIRQYQRDGQGFWPTRRHEAVLYSIAMVHMAHSSAPCIFYRERFQQLIAIYREQASAAQASSEEIDAPTRVKLAEELMLFNSAGERKRTARENKGTCWLCGAPKPRKTVCAVCGYMPRSI